MNPEPAFLLDQLVAARAAETPDAPALRLGKEALTYQALEDRVARLAAGLAAAGVRPKDRVAVYQPKSIDTVVAMLGSLRAGAAYVPLDPHAPAARARHAIAHAGVRALFAAGRPLKQLAGGAEVGVHIVVVPDDATVPSNVAQSGLRFSALLDAEPIASEAPRTSDDLAYVLYTSGSTGTPKGVAITHGQSLAFVRAACATFGFESTDVFASHAPFNFDLSVIDLHCAFAAGAEVVLIPDTWVGFPAKVAALIAEAGITVWNSVPSAIVGLLNRGQLDTQDLSRLRTVLFAGEPFALPALRSLRAVLPEARLYNVYGQTEANSSTYHLVDEIPEADDAPLPIGRPLPNYEVLLLDAEGHPVEGPEFDGELYVTGPAVASGYLGDPERTARAFVQHPLQSDRRQIVYRTGDRARRDAEGRLVFRGRADLAVKVRGFRVELEEIEAVCKAVDGVGDAVVAPVPEAELGHVLVLFVAAARGETVEEPALREALADKLPRYMRPERLTFRASRPLTGTGKVDRAALAREAKALLEES